MTENQCKKQPLLLITYPRSASNLLMRILSLPKQQEAVSRESGGYFFFPAAVSMNDAGLLRRPRTQWSESETDELRQKYQSCYDELQKLVDEADQQAKMAVTKEHAPFIMSPVAVSDFLHDSQDDAVPWKVKVPQRYRVAKRLPSLQSNPSALPDEFLLQCTPAFLIRHPALAFPSYYRVNLSFCDGDMAKLENERVPYVAMACTLRWTRQLYDWYAEAWTAQGRQVKEPIVLDADDMLQSSSVIWRFCHLVGLDRAKVKFHWDPVSTEEQGGVSAVTRQTLHSSSGITKGKSFEGLTIEGEAEKWKAEFGELVGNRLEGWVRAAMPDYTYLLTESHRDPFLAGHGRRHVIFALVTDKRRQSRHLCRRLWPYQKRKAVPVLNLLSRHRDNPVYDALNLAAAEDLHGVAKVYNGVAGQGQDIAPQLGACGQDLQPRRRREEKCERAHVGVSQLWDAKRAVSNGVGVLEQAEEIEGRCWIVDREDHNVLLPIGSEGELVIESPCLTKEYINNKCQTGASFVKNPEWVKSVGRGADVCIFMTGDVARLNAADSSFQLLGRKGTRIKIRGQRVELGEVEHQIRRLLPVAKSVVVDIVCTAEDALEQSPMLVAFILMSGGSTTDVDEPLLATPTLAFQKQTLLLDGYLKDVLPSFMVPTAYVELALLPTTSTGKLDRRRVREAAGALTRRKLIAYSFPRTAHTEPQSGEETMIRDLCAEILQLPSGAVGMNDTFVDLGGDSIMARHLITGAKISGLSINLQELFRPATLSQIAQSGRTKKKGETPNDAGSPEDFVAVREDFMSRLPRLLRQEDIEDVIPTLETQAAYASNRVVDCFPLHISGTVDVMRLQRACQALVARHAILRTVFHIYRKMLVQVVLRELLVPLLRQECDSWGAAVRWVDEYGSLELKKRYNMGKPIIGFVLVTVPSEARHILVMRLAHGQYDGLCLRPLIQDLWKAYRGVPLTVKAEFKAHVLECYRRQTVEAYDIWRGVLKGSQSPHLFQRVPAADDEATLSRTMRQLPEIRPLVGATPASMVKAAWFEALRHETKQDGAVFGQFLHAWTGNDGVIGPCMNVIPVRVRQSQGLTRRQIVQAIQLQHAETASADALGWSDIVSNCTDWPVATEVDSVVLHQNFDRDIEVVSDGIICKKEMPMLSSWAVFPMLLVTHPRESRLDALLLMSSRYRGLRDPVKMLNNFARALELLESHPDETLDSKGL